MSSEKPSVWPGRRIFLSYGHDEFSGLAARIRDDLQAAGHQVWFDAENLRGGQDWEVHIEKGLEWLTEDRENARFVLLMTPHSVRRPDGFCLNELAAALKKRLPIVPVMASPSEPPLSICRIQWVDMLGCWPIGGREERYRSKVKALLDVIAGDTAAVGAGEGLAQPRLLRMLRPLPFEADIAAYAAHFTGRQWFLGRVQAWLDDPVASRIMLITGPPGVGKTTMATWLCNNLAGVAAFHFCRYGNSQKTDARRCVQSIAYQLSTQLPDYRERLSARIEEEDLTQCDARTLFDSLIVQPLSDNYPSPGHGLLIVVDALDEATQGGRNEIAEFLAEGLVKTPEWLRLIVTTRPDPPVMHPLQGLVPSTIDPTAPENLDDIREYLRRELRPLMGGREVPGALVDSIVAKSEGLFLSAEWIVKELREGRLSLDKPGEFPRGMGGIYAQYIRRQFPDLEAYRQKIRPLLEVVLAAPEPLTTPFLAALLKWDEYDQKELYGSLGSLFIVDDEGFRPFHRTLTEWLTDSTMAGPYFVSVREGHRILGRQGWEEYRRGPDAWSRHTIISLPTHLCVARRWNELRELLSDVAYVGWLWRLDRFGLMKQWTYVEAHSSLRMASVYQRAIDDPGSASIENLIIVAEALHALSHLGEAKKVFEHLIDHYRRVGDKQGLKKALGVMGNILDLQGNPKEAMDVLEEWEALCRELGDMDHAADALGARAEIYYYYTNDYDLAMALLKEQEGVYLKTGNQRGQANSLTWQAQVYRARSDYDSSMQRLKEAEKVFERLRDQYNLGFNLGFQGQLLMLRGDLNVASSLMKEQERIYRMIGNYKDLPFCYYTQATILRMRGDLDGAMALYKEEDLMLRDMDVKVAINETLNGQGTVLRARGDVPGALALFKEQEAICRNSGSKHGLAVALGDEAICLRMTGDLERALALHHEEEEIYRGLGTKFGLARSFDGQATTLGMRGDCAAALARHDEALGLLRTIGYKYGLQEALGHKALTLARCGDRTTALTLLKEQETICREMGARLDLEECLKNQHAVIGAVPGPEPTQETHRR